ncbi:MAG: aminoacyl-tRNA hydrolase [Oscillospiraceae bacterium]|nr:aminoacyl-tRNA hydrolase [Oscillospiraceae bacterium]
MFRFFFGGKKAEIGTPDFIICGLGNPGLKYENTRHNCGFMAVDGIAESVGVKLKRLKFKSLTEIAVISSVKCLLMKPTTFMNKSGDAVVEAMRFYKIEPERTLIIYDDINGSVGDIRVRRCGSDGGQNGMKSIILQSGSDQFPRIKIGIGAKPHPDFALSDWVLSPFKKAEGAMLEKALDNALKAAELIIKGDIDTAMNNHNRKGG